MLAVTTAAAANGQPLRSTGAEAQLTTKPVQEDVSGSSPGAPSEAVDRLLHWVTTSEDNGGQSFIVIDKLNARIFAFDSQGKPLGAAPALIGIARGDDSAAGVGHRSLNKIPVEQRTTPAGRFIAKFGPAKRHAPVLWVDYADAISLHPVVTANKKERRLQRIQSASAEDHRISFGCINVPASFYSKVVKPLFKTRNSSSVVYILPDTKSLAAVFPGTVLQARANPPSQHAMEEGAQR
jgi:hypothetical protein